jgi:hypothetical protein
MGNMTSSKLSLNQNLYTKTGSMELAFKKSNAQDFDNSIQLSGGQIKMPNLCEAMGKTGSDCSGLQLTSQVIIIPSF